MDSFIFQNQAIRKLISVLKHGLHIYFNSVQAVLYCLLFCLAINMYAFQVRTMSIKFVSVRFNKNPYLQL